MIECIDLNEISPSIHNTIFEESPSYQYIDGTLTVDGNDEPALVGVEFSTNGCLFSVELNKNEFKDEMIKYLMMVLVIAIYAICKNFCELILGESINWRFFFVFFCFTFSFNN